MMICPACHYELLLHNDYCENCGAPAYLVTATADITHCTYCGARDERGSGDCATCGLKKNFKTSESLIGTCRNCGVAWHSVWMYCQTRGVARENGLVETRLPLTVRFQPDTSPCSTSGSSFQAAYSHNPPREQDESAPASRAVFFIYPDFDPTAEPEPQTLLSEDEVVERMYANGKDESTPQRKIDLGNFFSESEITDRRRPTAAPQVSQANERAAAGLEVLYDLSRAVNHEPAVAPTPPQLAATAPVRERQPPPVVPLANAPREEKQPEVTAPVTTPPQKPKTAAKPDRVPVQTGPVVNQPGTPPTSPIDRKLVKLIAVLIILVLLFSALIVSGFRLRDLFGKPQPQVNPQAEVSLSPSPAQLEILPGPEGMVQVPGGVFRMGTDGGNSFESLAHVVTMVPFFMDRTEVRCVKDVC